MTNCFLLVPSTGLHMKGFSATFSIQLPFSNSWMANQTGGQPPSGTVRVQRHLKQNLNYWADTLRALDCIVDTIQHVLLLFSPYDANHKSAMESLLPMYTCKTSTSLNSVSLHVANLHQIIQTWIIA